MPRTVPQIPRQVFVAARADYLSGVTDCYQPAEREFRLIGGVWRCRAFAQPLSIVTKNALVVVISMLKLLRTTDPGLPLAHDAAPELAREWNPARVSRGPAPGRQHPREAGIPVGVVLAPVIPGLNDQEIPRFWTAAEDAGATAASTSCCGYLWRSNPYSASGWSGSASLPNRVLRGFVTRDGAEQFGVGRADGRQRRGCGSDPKPVPHVSKETRTRQLPATPQPGAVSACRGRITAAQAFLR